MDLFTSININLGKKTILVKVMMKVLKMNSTFGVTSIKLSILLYQRNLEEIRNCTCISLASFAFHYFLH